jgi:hypothetical protein
LGGIFKILRGDKNRRMNFSHSSFIRQSWLSLSYNATPQLNFKTNTMTKNNYLMAQEYLLRLENECLIERIAKIEKELGLKEKENKELRIQLKMLNLAMADVS